MIIERIPVISGLSLGMRNSMGVKEQYKATTMLLSAKRDCDQWLADLSVSIARMPTHQKDA
jgi:hypothetical protein